MAKGFVLDSTSKSLQAAAATGSAQVDYVATWADSTATSFTEGTSDGQITSTTPADIVAAPASSTRRVIKGLTLYNRGAGAESITLSYKNSSNSRYITKVILASGQSWSLDDLVTTAADVTPASLVSNARNLLTNGSFLLARRHRGDNISFTTSTTTFKTVHTGYLFDRWFTLRQTATGTLNIVQASAINGTTTGGIPDLASGTGIKLSVGSISKFGIAQVIENRNCAHLAGQSVTLSFKAKAISTASGVGNLSAIDYAIISFNGTTADAINRTTIIPTWNATGVKPTLGAGYSFLSDTSKTLSTDWQTYTISAILPSTFKNIGVMIWSNNTTNATTDNLLITDVQLEAGLTATAFEVTPQSVLEETCRRYFIAYYPSTSTTRQPYPGTGSWSSNDFFHTFTFTPTMRIPPTFLGTAPSTFKTVGHSNYTFSGTALTPQTVRASTATIKATRGALSPTTSSAPVGTDVLSGADNSFIMFDAEL